MKQMQDMILGEIERRIEADSPASGKLTAVQRTAYANTGTIYAMAGLDAAFSIRYAFDDQTCRLHFQDYRDLLERATDNPPNWRLERPKGQTELVFHVIEYADHFMVKLAMHVVTILAGEAPVTPEIVEDI